MPTDGEEEEARSSLRQRELTRFFELLWTSVRVAQQCQQPLSCPEPTREAFDDLMGKIARLRGRFRDLPPTEQLAARPSLDALEDLAARVRRMLVIHDHEDRRRNRRVVPAAEVRFVVLGAPCGRTPPRSESFSLN